MFTFLLIVQTLLAASLVAVILMQRSEGGGLGVGGSSSGFMTARGASDFLTRSTAFLGGGFIFMSIALAAIAGVSREPVKVDTSLANEVVPAPVAPATGLPPLADPNSLSPSAPAPATPAPAANDAAPVPLAQ
ncbi:preprotein translocase subunit SecG [Sphingomonas sp.]|uniref:preprotein translocase subunit SecG n=1 Tax=Sphingomonas sp. TaxID=28214 RepID=UPI00286DFDB6|nr:preprotein translocase subunit SecG [Sphingomonas sp.]